MRPEPMDAAEPRRIRLRYPGTCAACGRAIAAGEAARYEAATKRVWCEICPEDADGDPDEGAIDEGVAGGSAQREYERRVANRERRTKAAWGDRLGGLLLAVTREPPSTRAWAQGAAGERVVAAALEDLEAVRVLRDRRVPGTRGNVDLLAVGPGGVFVIDAKRYTGMIRVRDVGGWLRRDLRLYVGRRDCSGLADAMAWQVDAVRAALEAAGIEPLPPVTTVLCFVDGEWPLLRPPERFRGVRLEGTRSIRRLVSSGDALDREAIDELVALLARAFSPK